MFKVNPEPAPRAGCPGDALAGVEQEVQAEWSRTPSVCACAGAGVIAQAPVWGGRDPCGCEQVLLHKLQKSWR